MRDVTQLHPRLQTKIVELKALCKKEGLELGIGECLRTVAEQNALYAQGRTTSGSIVTNAKGTSYSSQHQWGIAVDFYKNVKGHAFDDVKFFDKVGVLAKSIDLGWGGDWKNPVDKPHLYLPDWGRTTSALKKKYGTPEKFYTTWNKENMAKEKKVSDTKMPTIKKGSKGKAVKIAQIIVGVSADGDFGTKTYNAIVAFQKKKGLSADGIVGTDTWRALLESV